MKQQERFFKQRVIGKTFALPKYEDIILNSMTQTREKWGVELISEWDERAMVFPVFTFICSFRTDV